MRISIDTSSGTVEVTTDEQGPPARSPALGTDEDAVGEAAAPTMQLFEVHFEDGDLSVFEASVVQTIIFLALQIWSLRLRVEPRSQSPEEFASDLGWTLTGLFGGREFRLTPIPNERDQGR